MTRSESEWLLESTINVDLRQGAGSIFFAMLVSLRTKFTFSKH
jgi:hypothetical protein